MSLFTEIFSGLKTKISGLPLLNRILGRAEEESSNLVTEPDIADFILERTRQRYLSGVDPDGSAWEPVQARTLKRRKVSAKGDLPLYDAGSLYDSLHTARKGLVSGSFGTRVGSGRWVVTSDDPRMFWHHYGLGKGVPPRKILELGRQDPRDVEKLMTRRMNRALEGR